MMRVATNFKLYLFGSPHLERDGEALDPGRRKARALLVYLATTGQRHNREALAAMFWPQQSQRWGRADLSRSLSILNKLLGAGGLESDRETVLLSFKSRAPGEASLWIDAAEFQKLLALAEKHTCPGGGICDDCLSYLAGAVSLYRADFLHGFTLPDCPAFDEWQFFQTETLRQAAARALERLAQGYVLRNEVKTALPYARRWLELDPLHEPAHRQLMQIYALTGQRAAALRQYEECRRILQQEMGVPPEAETTSLYETIKAERLFITARNGISDQLQPFSPHPPIFLQPETSAETEADIFVGQNRELARLNEALGQTRAGSGRILFVIGGAGRGKSTLVQEFARRAQAADPHLIAVSGYCDAHTGLGDPYLPFREILTLLAGDVDPKWTSGSLSKEQIHRLRALMPIALPALIEYAPNLIDTFVPRQPLLQRAAALAVDQPPWLKELQAMTVDSAITLEQKNIFGQFTAFLKAIASRQPLLLILEDLHWIDTSSTGLLFHLSRQISHSPILIVGTYRPDELASSWGDERQPVVGIISELKRQHGDILLDLADRPWGEGRYFVDAYLDTRPNRFNDAFRELLFRRTEGHPLFTVELLRDMVELGHIKKDEQGCWIAGEVIDWDRVPARVEGVIEKRIGRLENELQNLLAVASVEGEVFTAEVVARVQQLDEQYVIQQFSRTLGRRQRLVVTESVEWLGQQRLSHYRFRHHLFQHYLYQSLDKMERTSLHQLVGDALETLYENQTEAVAVRLAHHFEHAGLTQKAVGYLLQAGQQSLQLSANEEAVGHLNRGLALLSGLPGSNERSLQELEFQLAIGPAYLAIKSHGAPEVERTYARARELAQELGRPRKLFQALWGLSMFYLVRSRMQKSHDLAAQCLVIAGEQQEPTFLLTAHRMLGAALFLQGQLGAAQEHFEQGISLYNAPQSLPSLLLYGQDNGIACLNYASWGLWLLGYPEQALQRSLEAVSRAQTLAHPFSLATALVWAASLHQFRDESQAALERAEAAITLASEYGFAHWLNWATALKGWALARQEETAAGIQLIRQSLANWGKIGMETTRPYFLGLLAEAYGQAGQIKPGLEAIHEALGIVEQGEERYWDAELYRLQGELLLAEGSAQAEREAETCFLRAVDIACSQQAKSLELRVGQSLERLRQMQGKQEVADQRFTIRPGS